MADNPFATGYCPKLDISPVVGPDEASHYQSSIGVMSGRIKIGHNDINTKLYLLSLHLAMPRKGHMETALHIMGYLKLRHTS